VTNFGFRKHYAEGYPRAANTERRCNGCRSWYPVSLSSCPECKHEAPRFNKWMRHALLNANLNRNKEAAIRDA
jgi:hypothetical protein